MSSNGHSILLLGIGASHSHTPIGLYYIKASMKDLQSQTLILEATTATPLPKIIEDILDQDPMYLGIGVYIWNTAVVLQILKILKTLRPEIKIILGGPEISYQTQSQEHFLYCDHVICGEADQAFYQLISNLICHRTQPKIISPSLPDLLTLPWPYPQYTDHDIKNRALYVEASRGCPYKCEYCLSSLDQSVRTFPIDGFLEQIEILINRGARSFKFLDRTFNLSIKISTKILSFFLQKITQDHIELFLHFEMIPDRLPEELKDIIKRYPAGALQFEIGLQTWNPQVSQLIQRRQKFPLVQENLAFLRTHTRVHTHVDLIVGLPGESLESFGQGLNRLYQLSPDEIQIGILKKLKGTPIDRHDHEYKMIYNPLPPFDILQTSLISAKQMFFINRFAKYWDLIFNSGNFVHTIRQTAEFWNQDLFARVSEMTYFLQKRHPQTFGISLLNLTQSFYLFLTQTHFSEQEIREYIIQDYSIAGKRDIPSFLGKNQDPQVLTKSKKAQARQTRRL